MTAKVREEIERQDIEAMRRLDVEAQIDEMVIGETTTERKMARTIARLLNKVDRLEAKSEGIAHDISRIRERISELEANKNRAEQLGATTAAAAVAAKAAVPRPPMSRLLGGALLENTVKVFFR